jgi:hypothetical protein
MGAQILEVVTVVEVQACRAVRSEVPSFLFLCSLVVFFGGGRGVGPMLFCLVEKLYSEYWVFVEIWVERRCEAVGFGTRGNEH